MKKSKIIIPALAMLVMSTAATVTGTVAWFSMNKTVTAEGMKISAQGQGSIIISKWVDDDSINYGLPKANDRTTGVDFMDSDTHSFQPSTHDLAKASGLKYISTGGNTINPETGTPANADALADLVYSDASLNTHYYDYDVYIAGDGQPFTGERLTITLEDVTVWGSGNSRPNIMNAVSVDFYGGASSNTGSQAPVQALASDAGYLGTLNLAKRENLTDHTFGTKASIVINSVNIPKAVTAAGGGKGTAGYAIKMRAYFDGALIDHAGTNGYASLTACGANAVAGTWQDGQHEFFYNSEGFVMANVTDYGSDTDISSYNYSVVNMTSSTTTFARTADIVDIQDVSLRVTFALGA